ncbi:ABC transporter ATP-binding protein [Aquitalea sp. ASV11]|uniref:ABC transporter ATP-binding protein n=1 Tax=Aquitalea sp. ASV11 TaxID=2795103 RepID=UPI0018EC34E0|nr:sn-glycerol-3-phosphate ABC transporter ATP-binding protein UgpC [Aquitalea sp. ASV11]
MAEVCLRDLVKVYEQQVVVRGINLDIPDGAFVVLVGPSGCGKSTTLRMIAGLESISHGQLLIDGKLANELPPQERSVAMVFQSYALYPHMTVQENLAFSLKLAGISAAERQDRIDAVVKTLELTPYLSRKPAELSGGQRQRVAMGRAIVREPKVFLFDEPLSNLDAKLRNQMRVEIKRLQHRLKVTTVYVTHDQVEAMTLADIMVVMKDGAIVQQGSPLDVFRNPVNHFVASFIGTPQMNFFHGTLQQEGEHFFFASPALRIPLDRTRFDTALTHGQRVCAGLRPEDIVPHWPDEAPPEAETFAATITLSEMLGNETLLFAESASGPLIARQLPPLPVADGQTLRFTVRAENLHLFDADSGISLRADQQQRQETNTP